MKYMHNVHIFVRESKKQFLGEKNDIVSLFTSHGTGLAPKTKKKLSSVKNETPYCLVPKSPNYGGEKLVELSASRPRRSVSSQELI